MYQNAKRNYTRVPTYPPLPPPTPKTFQSQSPKWPKQKSQEIAYGNSDAYDADDVDHEPDDADLKMV